MFIKVTRLDNNDSYINSEEIVSLNDTDQTDEFYKSTMKYCLINFKNTSTMEVKNSADSILQMIKDKNTIVKESLDDDVTYVSPPSAFW